MQLGARRRSFLHYVAVNLKSSRTVYKFIKVGTQNPRKRYDLTCPDTVIHNPVVFAFPRAQASLCGPYDRYTAVIYKQFMMSGHAPSLHFLLPTALF